MKYCVNCKHYRGPSKQEIDIAVKGNYMLKEATCVMLPKGSPDMIYGHQNYQTCDIGRRMGGSCGPDAKLYIELNEGKWTIIKGKNNETM